MLKDRTEEKEVPRGQGGRRCSGGGGDSEDGKKKYSNEEVQKSGKI